MRLRYKKTINRDELEKLRFKIGDKVLFEGTTYILTQIGLRFVYGRREDKPESSVPCMLYIKNIVRWMEPDPEPEENNPKYDLKED